MEPRHRIPPVLLERARSMRHDSVPAEKKLWCCLRNRQLAGLKFRRQQAIGPFIVDFVCAELSLVVELDGDSHADQLDYDMERTKWLDANGYRVIRYFNHDVSQQLDAVLESIFKNAEEIQCATEKAPHPDPLPRVPGRGDNPVPSPPVPTGRELG